MIPISAGFRATGYINNGNISNGDIVLYDIVSINHNTLLKHSKQELEHVG